MPKILLAFALFAGVLLSSLLGATTPAPAEASTKVNFISWPKDVIYVYDTTSKLKEKNGTPVWAVKAAAERWSAGNPVEFRYTTTGCPKDSQCVTVRQAELAAPAAGVTATGFSGADIKSSNVTLDTTYGKKNNEAKRRNVVCHELGHSLGLKHRTQTSSCLTSYTASQKYPDATDIKNLNTMYGYR
jgi:hypothetical protein